jgi:hypothetical protein
VLSAAATAPGALDNLGQRGVGVGGGGGALQVEVANVQRYEWKGSALLHWMLVPTSDADLPVRDWWSFFCSCVFAQCCSARRVSLYAARARALPPLHQVL